MANHLQDLGYAIERQRDDFEMAGIPTMAIRRFSRRTDKIEVEARKRGIDDPEEKARLGALTREKKDKSLTWKELRSNIRRWSMNVSQWKTPAAFFSWPHVKREINQIDAQVYRIAMDTAQELFGDEAKPCPSCGSPPKRLFWVCVTSPEADWDAGTGKVGFLTICERCHLQVDFLVDQELTNMQIEEWRNHRVQY